MIQELSVQIRRRNNRNLVIIALVALVLLIGAYFYVSDAEGADGNPYIHENIRERSYVLDSLCADEQGNVIYSVAEADDDAPSGMIMILPEGRLTFPPNTPESVKRMVLRQVVQQVYEAYLHSKGRIEELTMHREARLSSVIQPDGRLNLRRCEECGPCMNTYHSIRGGESLMFNCMACACPRECNAQVFCGCPGALCPACPYCQPGQEGIIDNPLPPGVFEPSKPRPKLAE